MEKCITDRVLSVVEGVQDKEGKVCYEAVVILPRKSIKAVIISSFPQVGHVQDVEVLPGVKREMKTLSMRPPVFGSLSS